MLAAAASEDCQDAFLSHRAAGPQPLRTPQPCTATCPGQKAYPALKVPPVSHGFRLAACGPAPHRLRATEGQRAALAIREYLLWPTPSTDEIPSLRSADSPPLATKRRNRPRQWSTRALREFRDMKPPHVQNRPARIAPALA